MEGRFLWFLILILCVAIIPVHCNYYHTTTPIHHQTMDKVTVLHFFLHISDDESTRVTVAHANSTTGNKSRLSFGHVFVVDHPFTEGPEPSSKVVGNARGLYVSAGLKQLTIVNYLDYGFTSGELRGSSISLFSRNMVVEGEVWEVAVVGGTGIFRMATGYAELKVCLFNATTGEAIVEYKVTVIHY